MAKSNNGRSVARFQSLHSFRSFGFFRDLGFRVSGQDLLGSQWGLGLEGSDLLGFLGI